MKAPIYNFFSNLLIACFSLLVILLQSCNQKDPDLFIPDSNGHGNNLTTLGRLVSSSWHYSKSLNGYNVSIYLDQKNLSSTPFPYSEDQQKLLFKLYKNGKAKFNFANNEVDTSGTNNDLIERSRDSYHKLDKEGNVGSWKANFSDSSLVLNFENNEYHLPPLKAKISGLTGSSMILEQISYFDSIYNNQKVMLKRVVTLQFEH